MSLRTSQPVMTDVRQRLPATMELIGYAVVFSVLIGVPLGVYTAIRKRGIINRAVFLYGMMAGALPDFWFALIAIFSSSFTSALPGPIGRIDSWCRPRTITGMYHVERSVTANPHRTSSLPRRTSSSPCSAVSFHMPARAQTAFAMEECSVEFVVYARAAGLRGS